ncbi:response regulator [Methanoregula sp.]|jgi:DNA-binding response OmpR family regulator|uniref:response regulator n=1 Tax=Methanoregula sp. TaxID=2052170 RepID=UPI0035653FA8
MTRILIVDDDVDILEILRLEFEDDPDCCADTATEVVRALALVQEHTYDVIITDWQMPVMNGTVFVSTLRQQGCTSYIIIYSGMDLDREIRETLDAGANYYIHRRGDPAHEFGELKKILKRVSAARPGNAE